VPAALEGGAQAPSFDAMTVRSLTIFFTGFAALMAAIPVGFAIFG
jgi:hypothetical protein